MRYIALVDKPPVGFEEGNYIRVNESNFIHSATSKLPASPFMKKGVGNAVTVAKIAVAPILAVPALLKGKTESNALNRITELEEAVVSQTADFLYNESYNSLHRIGDNSNDWELGGITLTDKNLKGNYSLQPKTLFSGLLDCIPGFNSDIFKKMMQSGGGSELIIIERDKVPRSFHLSDGLGSFSTGIYIPHPKLPNKLIPLKGSVEQIKDLILEEMITVLTLLGAKRIVIMEAVGKKVNAALSFKGVRIGGSSSSNMETLRVKEFGESPIDIERARKAVLFTADMPRFKTIFKAREHGNQTLEIFEETVDISAGLEAPVIKSFNAASVASNSKRYWSMEVEFYDKNNIGRMN